MFTLNNNIIIIMYVVVDDHVLSCHSYNHLVYYLNTQYIIENIEGTQKQTSK